MRITGWIAALVTAALAAPGCVITISDGSGGGDSNSPPPPTTITVNVINTTEVSLDPQIYFSDQFIPPDQLFVDANKFTAYGVGTLGFLADDDSSSFTVDCTRAVTFGTRGGAFGDDLANPIGGGKQIILRLDESVSCGQIVTLTYRRTAEGGFTTDFVVAP